MNYRHIYHAGSFADVYKHAVLCSLLQALCLKDKPYCYIDSHAGVGLYDLNSAEALRSPEYQFGIEKLLILPEVPDILSEYLNIVKSYQDEASLRFYPGSPLIAAHFMRAHDHLILNELHPQDVKALKQNCAKIPNLHCHQRDAYEFLPAILPPVPRRACILIDPPYEKTDESRRIVQTLEKCVKRFATGIYMIWYPIVHARDHQSLVFLLQKHIQLPMIYNEIQLTHKAEGLLGTGMIIINPPWQFESRLKTLTDWCQKFFVTNLASKKSSK